jgi:Putative adhesin
MRRAILLFVAVMFAVTAPAAPQRQLIGTMQDHSLDQAGDCSNFHAAMLTTLPARVQSQEQRDVSLSGVELVKVRASSEGGVSIRGWDRPIARLMVCKYAVSNTKRQAKTTLDAITVAYAGGNIQTDGPALDQTQAWWVNIILYVPRSASLEVAAANGGIAIRNMKGKVTAHATNGGISVANSDGEHKVTTENGGISLERISGRLEATTQHGMIALKLRDTHAAGIEARVDDGEIVCKVDQCSDGTWTADRKVLKMGAAIPSIRLSTFSAPIMIENVR